MQLHSGSIVSFSRKRSQLHRSTALAALFLLSSPHNFKALFSKRRRPPPSLPPPCSPSVSFVFPTVHFVLLPVFSEKRPKKAKPFQTRQKMLTLICGQKTKVRGRPVGLMHVKNTQQHPKKNGKTTCEAKTLRTKCLWCGCGSHRRTARVSRHCLQGSRAPSTTRRRRRRPRAPPATRGLDIAERSRARKHTQIYQRYCWNWIIHRFNQPQPQQMT